MILGGQTQMALGKTMGFRLTKYIFSTGSKLESGDKVVLSL